MCSLSNVCVGKQNARFGDRKGESKQAYLGMELNILMQDYFPAPGIHLSSIVTRDGPAPKYDADRTSRTGTGSEQVGGLDRPRAPDPKWENQRAARTERVTLLLLATLELDSLYYSFCLPRTLAPPHTTPRSTPHFPQLSHALTNNVTLHSSRVPVQALRRRNQRIWSYWYACIPLCSAAVSSQL